VPKTDKKDTRHRKMTLFMLHNDGFGTHIENQAELE
jgi:hypothetical protein